MGFSEQIICFLLSKYITNENVLLGQYFRLPVIQFLFTLKFMILYADLISNNTENSPGLLLGLIFHYKIITLKAGMILLSQNTIFFFKGPNYWHLEHLYIKGFCKNRGHYKHFKLKANMVVKLIHY